MATFCAMILWRKFLTYAGLGAGGVSLLFVLLSLVYPLPPLKPYSLVVEDRSGKMLQAFLAADGVWRLRTSPDEIPPRLKEILLRREDRWFYYHPGVNPLALARAVVQNIRAGRRVSGASTITMQIARMLEPKERTYGGKLREVFRALQLELRYSKKELLEIYLSMAPLGGNVEGLKSASLLYYQTPLERLNIAQLFDLTIIPGDPNGCAPDRHGDHLLEERRRQAAAWIARGYFSRADSSVLWNTPAAATRVPIPRRAPHFALRVREMAPSGGNVVTSLDLGTQTVVEHLLTNHIRPWQLRGVGNAAVLVVRNATRDIAAYAGSGDFDDAAHAGQVDAVRAIRSPGSTLKPFLYAFRMEQGELTPRVRLLDTPYDAEGFQAENYDGTFSGFVSADDALRRSLNVPLVRMLKSAGVGPFVDFASGAGILSLRFQRPRLGLSLILGGCGVTLEELVGAYASFPNGGMYAPLRCLPDPGGAPREGIRAFSKSSAWMVTEILSGLDRPDLPANFASATRLPAVAFKTGTSYGRRDAWAIGYTAEYTVGVWLGNVNQKGNPELAGSKAAAPLLIDILNTIATAHQKTILPRPADIRAREVCAVSGLVPGPRCAQRVDDVYSGSRTTPRVCDICKDIDVSPDGRVAYCAACIGDHPSRSLTIADYPPELLAFWRRSGVAFAGPPPHNPLCTRLYAGEGPTILSPSDNMQYFFTAQEHELVLRATSGVEVAEHAWYINDTYIGKNRAGARLFVALRDGEHTVTCVDDRGRASKVHFTVRHIL